MSSGRQVTDTRDELHEITRSLLETMNAERGYIISSNETFAARFNTAANALPLQFDQLAGLVHDDSQTLQQVMQLRADAGLCLNNERDVIAARNQSFNAAASLMAAPENQAVAGKTLAEATALSHRYFKRQLAAREEVWSLLWHTNLTTWLAGGFGVGSGLLALWLAYLAAKHQKRERDLVEARLAAEYSNHQKNVFLANLSHEIRTPINAILGFSELLGTELTSTRHRQFLQIIRSSADSLLQLISDILDMAKVEAGVMKLHPEPTDLREISDFIRTLLIETAARKNVSLECHLPDDLPHSILIDRIRFRQILANLVGNAVKFTDRGRVDVRFDWDQEPKGSHIQLVVEVQDTGGGIPANQLNALFTPFAQSGANREKEKQGAGLGLALVQRLTEAMGGAITVASTPGRGSTFRLQFPSIPISVRLPASVRLSPAARTDFNELRPASLLVVDDNEINCRLIAEIFAGSHHRLVFCSNGEDAVARARESKPDVILMDIRMPGMNGHETLAAIRRTSGLELVPSIAVSASTLKEDEELLKQTFSGYLRKPFSRAQLFNELSEFLPRLVTGENPPAITRSAAAESAASLVTEDLLVQLRSLMADPWPAIRDSAAINESKAFAEGLEGLGLRWRCRPLVDYAKKISEDAENYAVADLERHLGEFSTLVEQLGNSTSK